MTEQQPWQREIKKITHAIDTQSFEHLPADLRAWLEEYAARDAHKLNFQWLLAHCDDGVIWGEVRADGLHLSCDQSAFPVRGLALRAETLQQARLFGEQAELLIWRGPQDLWHATLRRDEPGKTHEVIDEHQLLWGYDPMLEGKAPINRDDFVQLREGSQGIVHAPPLGQSAFPTEMQRATLLVRHYLSEDDSGVVRITHSRLMKLGATQLIETPA